MNQLDAKGFALIISAPSGAGKSTLARILGQRLPGILTSVSTTTRQPRAGEGE
ncbi:MAG: guanylate kinase, partial [Magnetococcales bacterium]|nr:guanylate kinase [Magnetococcales bacterium]